MTITPFTIIIPTRFYSSRLPGKPLLDIAGKPMIQHVYERATESQARRIIIATDDERIAQTARNLGAEVCLTLSQHHSGTDRIQEAATTLGLKANEIVVNVQGDEPLLPAVLINQVVKNLALHPRASAATLCEKITNSQQIFDPNVVKVTINNEGEALYFSRAPIPWSHDHFNQTPPTRPNSPDFFKHVGIYAYRVSLLNEFISWQPSTLETTESLEQLRLLSSGHRIHVEKALQSVPCSVDTQEDLNTMRSLLIKNNMPEHSA